MNKLLGHIFVISLFAFSIGKSCAQQPLQRMNSAPVARQRVVESSMPVQRTSAVMRRVDMVRENFFNRQLRLTPEESEKFWPIYRQYQQELTNVRRLKRQNNSADQPNGAEQIRKELEYDAQLVAIRKKYNEEFLKIMPPEKVSELYKSEREFNDEMIRQLSERNAVRRGD